MPTNIEKKWFSNLIREQGLEDYSPFLTDGFFDEIPFFSRYNQLPPTEPDGRSEADGLLIKACLEYLDEMLSRGHPVAPMLAAITVIKEGRDDPIVPSIFTCCGAECVQSVLAGLSLIRARSALGLYLERLLRRLGSNDDYGLLQDSATVPGQPRIFIVRRHPPFPEIIGLDRLRQASSLRLDEGRSHK